MNPSTRPSDVEQPEPLEPPERVWLPRDTDADAWNILAKNPSRDWSTGEPGDNIEYARVSPVPAEDGAPAPPLCVKCGHNSVIGGSCQVLVSICSDDYHGQRLCGCKCVFAAPTGAPDLAVGDERVKEIEQLRHALRIVGCRGIHSTPTEKRNCQCITCRTIGREASQGGL